VKGERRVEKYNEKEGNERSEKNRQSLKVNVSISCSLLTAHYTTHVYFDSQIFHKKKESHHTTPKTNPQSHLLQYHILKTLL
jgi:hypothetical protein